MMFNQGPKVISQVIVMMNRLTNYRSEQKVVGLMKALKTIINLWISGRFRL